MRPRTVQRPDAPATRSRGSTVQQIMATPAVTIDKNRSLMEAIRIMHKRHMSKLPVLHEGRVVGVLTDGDVVDQLGGLRSAGIGPERLHVSSVVRHDAVTLQADAPASEALRVLRASALGILPVVDHDGSPVGVITQADFLPFVTSGATVASFMNRALVAVEPDARAMHARRLMLDHGIERLPVLRAGVPVGILGEMDLALALAGVKRAAGTGHEHARLRDLRVQDAMTVNPVLGTPDLTASEAARRLRDADVGALPIVDPAKGHIVGIVTRTDLLRHVHLGGAPA